MKRVTLASLKEIHHELYVEPALRADRRKSILDMKEEVLGKSAVSPERDDDEPTA